MTFTEIQNATDLTYHYRHLGQPESTNGYPIVKFKFAYGYENRVCLDADPYTGAILIHSGTPCDFVTNFIHKKNGLKRAREKGQWCKGGFELYLKKEPILNYEI